MRILFRWLRRLVVSLLVLVLLLAGGFAGLAWHTLPGPPEAAEIDGLQNPVAIAFDANGVPTIRARSEEDAAAALGYLHARERLFQMDLMRRGVSGRMAELFGPPALRLDRFTAALDLRARAERDLPLLPEDTRRLLEAYARGVNAWIDERGRFASLEFALLGPPAPWSAVDSILWGKAMGLFLGGNFRTELARLRLSQRLPRAVIEELWPRDASPGVPYAAGPLPFLDPAHLARVAAALPEFPGDAPLPSHASNAWVVAGSLSATGAPLLANDPHLAFTFPALWYLARVEILQGETVVRTSQGATAPGVPIMVLGQSFGARGGIAWGFTTTHGDTQDIFVERITPGRPDHYDTPEGPRPFEVREHVIPVRFGDPLTLSVRHTRHGVVISDLDPQAQALAPEGFVLAVAIASLSPGDTSATGLVQLGRATTMEEAEAALRQVHSPLQQVTVADRGGQIAMFTVGRVPIRRSGDGAWPANGWDGSGDWTGWIGWEAMPHVRNPETGRIAHANNRIVPDSFQPMIARDWFGDSRFRRIGELLAARPAHDVADFASMQADALSLPARELKPAMMAGIAPADAAQQRALALLAAWDGTMARELPQPLIWTAWTRRFLEAVLATREIGPGDWRENSFEFLAFVLGPGQHWCGGDCARLRAEALARALADIAERFGDNPDAWRWGEAHQVRLVHPLPRLAPGLARFLQNAAAPVAGDASTVLRAAPTSAGIGMFDAVHGAGFRGVYDLADPSRSRFAVAGGQSGHAFSAASSALLGGWARGDTIALPAPLPGAPMLILAPAR